MRACAAMLVAVIGCVDDAGPAAVDASGPLPAVRVRFELAEGAPVFGAVPFPDDLYRDAQGRVVFGGLGPLRPNDLVRRLAEQMSVLDGFGATTPTFFYFDGDIDPATLPESAAASMLASASVFLMDIDASSPDAFSRVPVDTAWLSDTRSLAVRPARGQVLMAGRRYVAVVTTAVADVAGAPVGPSVQYSAVLRAAGPPSDPSVGRVYRAHVNALAALANAGVDRDGIAGLAVFTVQTIGEPLDRLATQVSTTQPAVPSVGLAVDASGLSEFLGEPEPGGSGLDRVGGVPHDNVGWLIHGSVAAPNFLARLPSEVGSLDEDSLGQFLVKRVEGVPFTLSLPRVTTEPLPLVLFQHGLGRDRADMLAVANQFNAAGYAVLAIDAPYHGLRAPNALDAAHRFVTRDLPDGFADGEQPAATGMFLGTEARPTASLLPTPEYVRDAVRQTVVDWTVVLRALLDDTTRWIDQVPGLSSLNVTTDAVAFVGIDVGGQVGALLLTVEPRVTAGVLVGTGGGLAEMLVRGPRLQPYGQQFVEAIGGEPRQESAFEDWLWSPEVALWQTLAERGDVLAFSPRLRRRARDLLMVMVRDDELVANRSTETLAAALRLPVVEGGALPRYVTLPFASAPVVDNSTVGGEQVTQALFVHASATHEIYTHELGVMTYESGGPPFALLGQPRAVDNPIDAAHTQVLFFLESWRAGSATVIDPNAQARIAAP